MDDQYFRTWIPTTPQDCFNFWVEHWAFATGKEVKDILQLAMVKADGRTYTGDKA